MLSGQTILDSWYSDDQLLAYTFSPYPSGTHIHALRYILREIPDLSFETHLYNLRMITPNKQTTPSSFICFEPGLANGGSSHYIYGVMVGKSLLIINPLGLTHHKNFYSTLLAARKKLQIKPENVFISTTKFQLDARALESCGPICVELMRHIAQFSSADLQAALASNAGGLDAGGNYQTIDLSRSLLIPSVLKQLFLDEASYNEQIALIRRQHQALIEDKEAEEECAYITNYMFEYDGNQKNINMDQLQQAQQDLSVLIEARSNRAMLIAVPDTAVLQRAAPAFDTEEEYKVSQPAQLAMVHQTALASPADEVVPRNPAIEKLPLANPAPSKTFSNAIKIGAFLGIIASIAVAIVFPATIPAVGAFLHFSTAAFSNVLLLEIILGAFAALGGALIGALAGALCSSAEPLPIKERANSVSDEHKKPDSSNEPARALSTRAKLQRDHGLRIAKDHDSSAHQQPVDDAIYQEKSAGQQQAMSSPSKPFTPNASNATYPRC
ncbi:MAG: hypothetical protein P4M14_04495 [Gammaproteobacteria bacterium]|nr:hypothetical protein [Gammaproteobacteria bacterium]